MVEEQPDAVSRSEHERTLGRLRMEREVFAEAINGEIGKNVKLAMELAALRKAVTDLADDWDRRFADGFLGAEAGQIAGELAAELRDVSI